MKNKKMKKKERETGVIVRLSDVISVCQLQMPKADGLTAALMSRPHPHGACILQTHLDGQSVEGSPLVKPSKACTTSVLQLDPEKYFSLQMPGK